MQKALTIIFLLNAIATVALSLWALFLVRFAAIVMWDTNLEAFNFALTDEQRESILWRQDNTLQSAVFPLLLTNVVWMALLTFCYFQATVVTKSGDPPESTGSDN